MQQEKKQQHQKTKIKFVDENTKYQYFLAN